VTTRQRVVEEALRWEGTPYHSHARILGVGVDCANMPAAVYEAAGLVPHLAPEYSNEWHMHRNEEVYLSWVTPYAREIDESLVGPGDFVIWRFGRTFSHGAIVIDPPVVLHAAIAARAVVRGDMSRDAELISRPRRCFTLWDTN
jgi:cell wall-associated NlpC family hydrolase